MAPPLTGKSLILPPPTEGEGSIKRILCSLIVATLPFGSVIADRREKGVGSLLLTESGWLR
jgi:hypothetical protein